MQYSKKMIDHCENPRNVGTLDKNDRSVGTGLVGSPACGDMLKLQIKVGKGDVIEDAKFKTFGCGGAISSSSLTTEKIKGKTIKEALALKNEEIVKELDLPKSKIHCSVMAEEAIKAAVKDYRKKNKRNKATK
ncbi:Fe-S cluster assembly scaffold IscU [Pseudomonadota bacterium]